MKLCRTETCNWTSVKFRCLHKVVLFAIISSQFLWGTRVGEAELTRCVKCLISELTSESELKTCPYPEGTFLTVNIRQPEDENNAVPGERNALLKVPHQLRGFHSSSSALRWTSNHGVPPPPACAPPLLCHSYSIHSSLYFAELSLSYHP